MGAPFADIGTPFQRLSEAGGGGARPGDIRLFPSDPGSRWLRDSATIPRDSTHEGVLLAAGLDNWITRPIPSVTQTYNDVTYGNGTFVAVGQSGKIAYSGDGETWTEAKMPAGYGGNALRCVAFGNGRFLASGDGGTVSSVDGVTWDYIPNGTGYPFTIIRFIPELGQFVACTHQAHIVYKTTDGSSFTTASTNNSASYTSTGIAYGNGRLVVSQGRVARVSVSTDKGNSFGFSDSGIPSPITELEFFNGQFIALHGATSYVSTSTDGVTWTYLQIEPNGNSYPFNSVTYAEGLYIICGQSNIGNAQNQQMPVVFSSTDLVNWNRYTYPGGMVVNETLTRVIYAAGKFVMVGGGTSPGGRILTTALNASRGFPMNARPLGKESWGVYTRLP